MDFVQDFADNIKEVKKGLHSVEDIYFRKINAAAGTVRKENAAGMIIAGGRQAVKDLFDIYYLSEHHSPI